MKAIRGFSDFGFSYVYVIFEDGTDMYWARTRVLEYLSKITSQLPADVKTELGPDASSVGWVFQYALVDRSCRHSSDEILSFQDWNLRYAIQSVPGVSEVATVGGQVRQYQVTVNPNALASFKLPLDAVIQAVRRGNNDVGGRLVEFSGREYMVRGRGYVKSIADIENLVLRAEGGTPVLVKDVAVVALGREGETDGSVWFLGADSLAAAEAYRTVKTKIADYFTRSSMAACDPRAAAPLSRPVEDYLSLAARDLSANASELAAFPLAAVAANKPKQPVIIISP